MNRTADRNDCNECSPVIKTLAKEIDALRAEIDALKRENAELRKKADKSETMPDKFMGWTLQCHRKRGYWQAWKQITGKTRWIHVGRHWDTAKMTEKIKAFESGIDS